MKILMYALAALCAYCVGGFNSSIIISKAVYKKDIREFGSKNPGFTNFKRTFGGAWAWVVFAVDISKAALAVYLLARLLEGEGCSFKLGAAYTGVFVLLGNAYPIWYGFKGGKGFLACLSMIWVISPQTGAVATLVMVVLLLTTKYMSLSSVTALLISPILLYLFSAPLSVVAICACCVLFVAVRHKENFKRLLSGNESRFELFSHTAPSK